MMPLVASFAGYLLLGSPFSWVEILLSVLSLFGVLLVASPDTLFPSSDADADPDAVYVTSRIWALCVGLLGVCGSAAAFLCMSAVGKTENPLTVVNYFAALCTVVSCVGLIVLPGLDFKVPGDAWEWLLLFFSGLSGFLMVSSTQERAMPGNAAKCCMCVADFVHAAIPHHTVSPGREIPRGCQHGVHSDCLRTGAGRTGLPHDAPRNLARRVCVDLRVCSVPGVAQDKGEEQGG